MPRRYTTEEFISLCNEKHNDFYNYSEVEYLGNNKRISIICPIHGQFSQIARWHLHGHRCPKCVGVSKSNSSEFIEKSIMLHGYKYDYSKVSYINCMSKVIIGCPVHGYFSQKPNDHLMNHGCPNCAIENNSKKRKISLSDFLNRCSDVHGNSYDYNSVDYQGFHKKIKITCPVHGEFKQTPAKHLSGQGCPKCNESKGEIAIRDYLEKINVKFVSQWKCLECKYKNPLIFDFYLPDHKLLIEYDGEQHFFPKNHFGGYDEFLKIKNRDTVKNKFANKEKFKLLRISYTEFNKIDRILKKNIK